MSWADEGASECDTGRSFIFYFLVTDRMIVEAASVRAFDQRAKNNLLREDVKGLFIYLLTA